MEAVDIENEQFDQVNDPIVLEEESDPSVIPLTDFINGFGKGLMESVQKQNPPIYDESVIHEGRELLMDDLIRQPFDAQRDVIHAVSNLLIDQGEPAAVINGEMGTGKTLMGIVTCSILHNEGFKRTLVISPPHLVYKWRREIQETVPNAKVWILNGPDTLAKLLAIREALGQEEYEHPEFFIMGRVRMRLGFNWKKSVIARKKHVATPVSSTNPNSKKVAHTYQYAACPDCGSFQHDEDGNAIPFDSYKEEKQNFCYSCNAPLWALVRKKNKSKSRREIVSNSIQQLPTIGPKSAEKLLDTFGEDLLSSMISDNVYEFVNLMDEDGELVFNDRQALRIERALGKMEFSFGQGGYQPTEMIKRYLPKNYFSNLLVDEGHEYKNGNSAQGQAMGVLCSRVKRRILLSGTLMGGYASDLFYLLYRMMPSIMISDGYKYNSNNSIGPASTAFMRDHGVLKDILKETSGPSHRTARGNKNTVRTSKAPGFGPKGVARYVLPYTAFLKLKDIGQNVLPPYNEHFIDVEMTSEQSSEYSKMRSQLEQEMKKALALGDVTLLGLVISVLLRWPDTGFKPEAVKHPRTRALLSFTKSVFDEDDIAPKEEEVIRIAKAEKAKGRRVLIYTTYTGKHDTARRMKDLLTQEGIKTSVLRSTVDTQKREDWILNQVDNGCNAIICNPELVKTGLDLLEFPTIIFMNTGYNVYTLMQASRRSWRIGQRNDVNVYYLGYNNTAQIACLELMAKKIAVTQSTSGDMPDSGLDGLNSDGDSVEVALAKKLLAA